MSKARAYQAASRRPDDRMAARLFRSVKIWKLCLEMSAEVGIDDLTLKRAVRLAKGSLTAASCGQRSRWGVWSAALAEAGGHPKQIDKAAGQYLSRLTAI